MQNEMMNIMQEKQQLDKRVRGEKLDIAEKTLGRIEISNKKEGNEQRARIETMKAKLRKLDDENRELDNKLKDTQICSSLRLKENQGIILNLQEELSDAKWELGAREKGADYITLLNDRKERKRLLDKARKELVSAQERISELERINKEYVLNKKDLDIEIEASNNHATSVDSSEHVSGLKRQIKSLKQHNAVLEQKLDAESRDLMHKDTKLKILEFELARFKNPAQTAIRGVFSELIPSFGRKSAADEKSNACGPVTRMSIENDDDSDCTDKNDFSVIDDIKGKELDSICKSPDSLSTDERDVKGSEQEEEDLKNTGTGAIWSLFSPRKKGSKIVKNTNETTSSLTKWDSKLSTKDEEKEFSGDINSDELDNTELLTVEDTEFQGSAKTNSENENERD